MSVKPDYYERRMREANEKARRNAAEARRRREQEAERRRRAAAERDLREAEAHIEAAEGRRAPAAAAGRASGRPNDPRTGSADRATRPGTHRVPPPPATAPAPAPPWAPPTSTRGGPTRTLAPTTNG